MLTFFLAGVLAFGSGAHAQADSSSDNPTEVKWLGHIPLDESYSTRMLSFVGDQGIIVREDMVLVSDDGGFTWKARNKENELPQSISDAWLASSNRLLILSGGALLGSSNPGSPWQPIDISKNGVNYLGITGIREGGRLVLVGERRVAVTSEQFAELPKYAQDSSTSSPNMVVPAISVSNDDGVTWRSIQLPKAIGYLDGVKVSGAYGVAWGPYAVYASGDGGLSWKVMHMRVTDEEEEAYPISGAIAEGELHVSLKNGRVLAGSIAGHNLSTIARLPSPVDHLTFFDCCTGYAITSEKAPNAGREDVLVKTGDSGVTWNPVLHSERIVAISRGTNDLYGATSDRAFRIAIGPNTHTCGNE